ncbi:hypothetical protein ACF0H5_024517 [Mactra antiquata]
MIPSVQGTVCYSCPKMPYADAITSCSLTETCPKDQVCFSSSFMDENHTIFHSLGCADVQTCENYITQGADLIGKRNTHICKKCCLGDRCNTDLCKAVPSGVCNDWYPWMPCSVTCGHGHQTRLRECRQDNKMVTDTVVKYCLPGLCHGTNNCVDAPSCADPGLKNTICAFHSTALAACPNACGLCPIDGQWSDWSQWSSCSISCGKTGHMTRNRSCDNPAPKNNGTDCVGVKTEQKPCDSLKACPVDGGWGSWSGFTSCSVSCGDGLRFKTRACNNPKPSNGGSNCPGQPVFSSPCNLKDCPVDGHWSDWSPWRTCSVTCGDGTKIRVRTCSNPPPTAGGKPCENPLTYIERQPCSKQACPVDGGWGSWLPFSHCSHTCGTGTKSRLRYCNNPQPSNGGKQCPGTSEDKQSCHDADCRVPTTVKTTTTTTTTTPKPTTPSTTVKTTQLTSPMTSSVMTSTHLMPVIGCIDKEFCLDAHVRPVVCDDAYMSNTYCPKLCGLCGGTQQPHPCEDQVGQSCHDQLYAHFVCADKELSALCSKTCGLCH